VRVLYSREPTLSGLFLFFTKVYIGGVDQEEGVW